MTDQKVWQKGLDRPSEQEGDYFEMPMMKETGDVPIPVEICSAGITG